MHYSTLVADEGVGYYIRPKVVLGTIGHWVFWHTLHKIKLRGLGMQESSSIILVVSHLISATIFFFDIRLIQQCAFSLHH